MSQELNRRSQALLFALARHLEWWQQRSDSAELPDRQQDILACWGLLGLFERTAQALLDQALGRADSDLAELQAYVREDGLRGEVARVLAEQQRQWWSDTELQRWLAPVKEAMANELLLVESTDQPSLPQARSWLVELQGLQRRIIEQQSEW